MQIKQLFFEFFLDFQLNSSTQIFFNSKSSARNYTNGGKSYLKLQANIKKNFFYQL